jgi:hypothetical protein
MVRRGCRKFVCGRCLSVCSVLKVDESLHQENIKVFSPISVFFLSFYLLSNDAEERKKCLVTTRSMPEKVFLMLCIRY